MRLTATEPIEQVTIVAIYSPPTTAAPAAGHIANAAVEQPQVITRAGWGANENLRYWQEGEKEGEIPGEEKWPPDFYPVQKLIVHHTAGANNDPDPAATIRAIYFN